MVYEYRPITPANEQQHFSGLYSDTQILTLSTEHLSQMFLRANVSLVRPIARRIIHDKSKTPANAKELGIALALEYLYVDETVPATIPFLEVDLYMFAFKDEFISIILHFGVCNSLTLQRLELGSQAGLTFSIVRIGV